MFDVLMIQSGIFQDVHQNCPDVLISENPYQNTKVSAWAGLEEIWEWMEKIAAMLRKVC